jgi:hypothetical protein
MLLNLSEIRNRKIIISGMQHAGKTFLAERIASNFKSPAIYSVNLDDRANYWNKDNYILISTKDFIGEADYWFGKCIAWAKRGKIDCIVIDDADILFKTHFDVMPNLRDLWSNHYHYNLTLILISHRLNDIPRRLYGQTEVYCLFTIEDLTTVQTCNELYGGMGDMIKSIPLGSYQFVLKFIGQPPRVVKIESG